MPKVIIILYFCLMVSCAVAPTAVCENFRYESRGRRDPFVPLVGQERPAVIRPEDITSIDDVKLEGIAIGPKGDRVAIINGAMLKENDRTGETVIEKIEDKEVILSISGKEHRVKLIKEREGEGE